MISLGKLHLFCALVALGTGTWVVLRAKGTATHRRVGWIYAASMLLLNVTALLIYRLTGSFGPFHLAAVVSLATVIAGIFPAWRRRPREKWLDRHYFFMAYSYLGLLAAAIAEAATRVPAVQAFAGGPTPIFWVTVVAAAIAVFVVGGRIVRGRFAQTTEPFRDVPPNRA